MSSDHGGPSRGCEESQASTSSSSASVLGSDVRGQYRSTVPSQVRSRSSSVIREESGLPSTARRSSSPASSAGSPSHGDQEMGDVLETLAQPLVLNMLEGASNVSEDLGVILLALDMIHTWIYTHTEHPGTTPMSINLSGIRRNAMRISDHINSLIQDFNAQGEDSTVRLPQQQLASTPGTSTPAGTTPTGPQPATSGGDSMNIDPPGASSGPTTSRGSRGAILGRGPPLSVNRATRLRRPATRVIPTYASAARKGAAIPEAVIAMARAAPALPADRIAEAARVISGQGKGKAKARSSPKFTSSGPSHKQVLVSFDKERGVPSMNLAMVSAMVSTALRNGGKRLRVQSTSPAYDGWFLSPSAVATTAEIDIIRGRIREVLPQDRRGNDSFWVGAPASTSYLRILYVQYFKQPGDPTSVITAEEVREQFRHSPLQDDLLVLTGPP
ncbi:hypothetical protein L218DRAFT_1005398 [Marasmius fiardii PR-910]|nr:hypothetical protein L218DRAFT_1005398 [Marasmius fiardii PR-910]